VDQRSIINSFVQKLQNNENVLLYFVPFKRQKLFIVSIYIIWAILNISYQSLWRQLLRRGNSGPNSSFSRKHHCPEHWCLADSTESRNPKILLIQILKIQRYILILDWTIDPAIPWPSILLYVNKYGYHLLKDVWAWNRFCIWWHRLVVTSPCLLPAKPSTIIL